MYSFINWVLNQGLDITRQTATTFDSFVMYEEYEFNISKPTAYEEVNVTAPHLSSQIIINTYQRLYALQICTGYKHWNDINWQPRDDIEYGDFRPYIASTRGLRKDYQERAYSYILDELLYAAENKESVLALKEYGITSLCKILELIRTPGRIVTLKWKDQNNDKDKKMLHEEQYRELLALYSYFNLAQIMYGPIANGVFNIFKTTRNDFKDFVDLYFDESKPIIYSEDGELLKQLSSDERWRGDADINFGYDNSDSTLTLTPTVCDNKWWQCHYFQPTALEIYDGAYNHELYWNEINWPPPDINTDDDYGNSYIARVLSQPMATILKYHNNGFCDNGEYAACRIQRGWRSYILRLHLARPDNTINGLSATIRTQLKWKESLAVKLSLKLKESSCRDPSKVDCIPSHTSEYPNHRHHL